MYLIGCSIYTVWNYETLSAGEGWGIVAMVGLVSLGIFALLIDLVLRLIIKNRLVLNLSGAVVAVILAFLLILG